MQTRTVIVARGTDREAFADRLLEDCEVVTTPLELIIKLEADQHQISTVELIGDTDLNRELSTFLGDTYPDVRVVQRRQNGALAILPTHA